MHCLDLWNSARKWPCWVSAFSFVSQALLMFLPRAIGTTEWDDEHAIWKVAWHVSHTVNR